MIRTINNKHRQGKCGLIRAHTPMVVYCDFIYYIYSRHKVSCLKFVQSNFFPVPRFGLGNTRTRQLRDGVPRFGLGNTRTRQLRDGVPRFGLGNTRTRQLRDGVPRFGLGNTRTRQLRDGYQPFLNKEQVLFFKLHTRLTFEWVRIQEEKRLTQLSNTILSCVICFTYFACLSGLVKVMFTVCFLNCSTDLLELLLVISLY